MNSKKIILLSCVVPCVFAVSPATAQMRGHGASMAGMPMHRAPVLASAAQMPMQRAPMLHSTSGFHRFNDGDFDRDDRFRRINRVIVIDNFAFPSLRPFHSITRIPTPIPTTGIRMALTIHTGMVQIMAGMARVARWLCKCNADSQPLDITLARSMA